MRKSRSGCRCALLVARCRSATSAASIDPVLGAYVRAAALGGLGIGEGVVVLAEFLDVSDLAVLDQRQLGVVERHLGIGSFYARAEADVRHHAVAHRGQLARFISESVDRVEPVLEVATNALVPSVGAGVRGILDSLPDDVIRQKPSPPSSLPVSAARFPAENSLRIRRTLLPSVIRRESPRWSRAE
jgi:hypothetical protein